MLFVDAPYNFKRRPRRNRKSPAIRALVQETHLLSSDFIAPFFVIEGEKTLQKIPSLPGVYRWTLDLLLPELEKLIRQGLQAIALFPCIPTEKKDEQGSYARKAESLIPKALQTIKKEFPNLCVIADVALDPYTSHGHDGLLGKNGNVKNDETVSLLCEMATLYAGCGADMVAPSDMMDGRIGVIREKLDFQGYQEVSILAYTAKYASSLYAPFREAVGSTLLLGDKKNYQMNPSNIKEAILEAKLDEDEGADILMVKPALLYLDVIAKIKQTSHLPICAFHVSGEYAMVMAADERGFLDHKKVFYESFLSIKRAGADIIISYAVPLIFSELNAVLLKA